MKNKIQPLHDRVVILPTPVEDKTKSGIIIPDTAKEKPQTGTVKYCGKGNGVEPMSVKVGDTVMYAKMVGQPIFIEDVPHIILREADIMAII
jgi:chaperonin GroES